jgi:mono/diheme cytochrome c family protein/plastocyanin
MKRTEVIARLLILAIGLAAVVPPLWIWQRTPLIHVHMAENGGWSPDALQAQVGEPLHLRLISDDVMHGFAVGQMDMQSVDVAPGKVTNVTLNFQKPGTYTFYCTRWCGINHWRMRGTIEVSGPAGAQAAAVAPLYVRLGLDLDAPHEAVSIPGFQPGWTQDLHPSEISVQQLTTKGAIAEAASIDSYRSHSPYETWRGLRANPSLANLDGRQIWNLVAFIWQSNTSPQDIAEGKKLFAQNCAACHGEAGGGNGVFAAQLAATGEAQTTMTQRPANLADPKRMLGASPALLQGKILRGGMGTGMPSWGPIFTEDQTWKIVSYLYTLQFQEITK